MPNGGAPARPFSPFRRRRFGLTIATAFGTVLGAATRRSDCRIRRTTPGAHRDPCRSRSGLMLRAQECTSQRPLINCETARVNASHLVRGLMDAATARARAALTFLPLGPALSQSAREAASCRIRAALRSICRTRCTTGAQSALHDTCHTARRDATTVQHTTQIATPAQSPLPLARWRPFVSACRSRAAICTWFPVRPAVFPSHAFRGGT